MSRNTVLAVLYGTLLWGVPAFAKPLIIDHTAVDRYSEIPQQYIDKIKTRWVSMAGESHAYAYLYGCQLLSNVEPRFRVSVLVSGTPEQYTTNHLRMSGVMGNNNTTAGQWVLSCGEEDWYTSTQAVANTQAGIAFCNSNIVGGLHLLGFVWCWDMTWHNDPGGGINTNYGTRWAGASEGGPDGDRRWGLTTNDYALTGNNVCMDTYLQATETYRAFCVSNGLSTRVIFTTGAVDDFGSNERSYQGAVKNQYIRNYVSNTTDAILFDYADILCWDNSGSNTVVTWTDLNGKLRRFPAIAPDNKCNLAGLTQPDVGHIGERGALRLAKALWVMLARIEGWNPDLGLKITRLPGGIIGIEVNCSPGIPFTIETCGSWSQPQWTELLTMSTTMVPFTFLDNRPRAFEQFYRVRQP